MKRILIVLSAVAALFGVSWGASAAWLAGSAGSASAKALSMPTGATPTAPASSTGSVTLTWTAATLAGNDLTTYTVRRYPAAGGAGTVITCGSQTITNHVVSCTYTETTAGSYQYTDTPQHQNWVGTESAKSGTTVVTLTVTRTFSVALAVPGNKTAGSGFNVTLQALNNGTIDTTYTGSHTLTFSGPGNAPNGQTPTYPASVSFTAGVGTANVTLFKAESNVALTVSEASPARSGSTTVTVVAGAQNKLAYSVACPGTSMAKSSTWTTAVDILDQWSNPTIQGLTPQTINLASSSSGNGSLGSSSVTVAANANPARSGTFTYTADSGSNKRTTITASVTGGTLTQVQCFLGTS